MKINIGDVWSVKSKKVKAKIFLKEKKLNFQIWGFECSYSDGSGKRFGINTNKNKAINSCKCYFPIIEIEKMRFTKEEKNDLSNTL